jgi:hypothetical protein
VEQPQSLEVNRCTAAEVAQVVLRLLDGEAFLAQRSWEEIWWGEMQLDLASGWQLQIAIERDQLGALLQARAPDGRCWEYGCERDDWTLGPASRIVEPLELLTAEQRRLLERLLRQAHCWPPLLPVALPLPDAQRRPARRCGRSRHARSLTDTNPQPGGC